MEKTYSKYEQETRKYSKKDTIIALCAWLVVVVINIAFWVMLESFEFSRIKIRIFQLVLFAIIVGGTFIIVIARKQGLTSIGFHKDRLWAMLRFGLLLLIIILGFGLVPGLIYG